MTNVIERFVKETRENCDKHGIRFYLGRGKRVNVDGFRSNGYFDAETLAVATNKPTREWLRVLVHETCHMDQWIEKSPYWKAAKQKHYNLLYAHMRGEAVNEGALTDAINKIIELEADCEKRAYDKVIEKGLPIDLDFYAKVANSYLWFHHSLLIYGKWYKTAPYELKNILDLMPVVIGDPSSYKVEFGVDFDLSVFEECFR